MFDVAILQNWSKPMLHGSLIEINDRVSKIYIPIYRHMLAKQ